MVLAIGGVSHDFSAFDNDYKNAYLCHLATVATEPFDVEAFSAQNKQLLSAVAAFEPDDQELDDIPTATSTIKTETAGCSTNVAAKCLSPRNRLAKTNAIVVIN